MMDAVLPGGEDTGVTATLEGEPALERGAKIPGPMLQPMTWNELLHSRTWCRMETDRDSQKHAAEFTAVDHHQTAHIP